MSSFFSSKIPIKEPNFSGFFIYDGVELVGLIGIRKFDDRELFMYTPLDKEKVDEKFFQFIEMREYKDEENIFDIYFLDDFLEHIFVKKPETIVAPSILAPSIPAPSIPAPTIPAPTIPAPTSSISPGVISAPANII
jgi:hypothetical protein